MQIGSLPSAPYYDQMYPILASYLTIFPSPYRSHQPHPIDQEEKRLKGHPRLSEVRTVSAFDRQTDIQTDEQNSTSISRSTCLCYAGAS